MSRTIGGPMESYQQLMDRLIDVTDPPQPQRSSELTDLALATSRDTSAT